MRASAWALPATALAVWLICVAGPIAGVVGAVAKSSDQPIEMRSTLELLTTSCTWAGAVALLSIIIGWAPGRVVGKAMGGRRFVPVAALALMPICLPSYVIFYAWWQSWPADTALHRLVIEHGWMQHARAATLLVGLLCWSWPIVAICVAGFAARTPAYREETLALDGAGRMARFADHLRCDGVGLALGGILVFLATINNTTCFDLAEVFTFSNELRAIEALGASPSQVLGAGAPAMAIAFIGLGAAVWLMQRRASGTAMRIARPSTSALVALGAVWTVSVALPMFLFAMTLARSVGGAGLRTFVEVYGQSLASSLGVSAVSAGIASLVSVGFAVGVQHERTWPRVAANLMMASWLLLAIVPGTIVGAAIEAAYNRAGLDVLYRSRFILTIGHLAAFGFIAGLFGRWAGLTVPPAQRDAQRLDGTRTLIGFLQANRPRIIGCALASFAIVFVLSMGEIAVTAQINPPAGAGASPLALSLLNDMHYQRPQTVLAAALLLLVGSAVAAAIAAKAWLLFARASRIRAAAVTLMIAAPAAMMVGCGADDSGELSPLPAAHTFGRAGRSPGQFGYPRAIAVDQAGGFVYVIDKLARVQRFSLDGEPQHVWSMPEMVNGKPTGVSVAPDGSLYVADTHYFRVIAYDPEGRELFRFGEFGKGPGQFIYPTDIAFGPEGRLYVSEYGGNDRVQVFSSSGEFLFEFGGFGSEAEQFNRPQSLAFNSDQSELFIADACNHRIVVTDAHGRLLRILGSPGKAPGQLTYPYSVTVLDDDTLLVCEFGNNRVQRLAKDGKCLGLYGGIGREVGRLQYPWAVAATDRQVFVVDSGNNRVQIIQKKL